jgi:hypothetical protein
MRAARTAFGEAVASGSRNQTRAGSRYLATPLSSRPYYHGAFHPAPTTLDKGKGKGKGKRREDIKYDIGGVSHSTERQAFFAKQGPGEVESLGADWGSGQEEIIEGIEPGRVVECRRCVVLQ